jgi:porin
MHTPFVTRLRSAALSSVALAFSWILAGPGTAHAQAPPAPPPGYLFDMSSMGKAWGDMLKGYGIYVNGGFEEDLFGYLSGGRKTGAGFQGEYTLGLDLDLKQIAGIPGAAIHISTDDRTGENPSRWNGSGIANTANYGPNDAYRLGELSYDQDLFNDHVRILVGRIADNIDFSSSELYCQFLFSTCGNGPGGIWYFNNDNPSYPVANWGGRITIKPTLSTYFRTGAYQEESNEGASNEGGFFDNRWGFSHNEGVFVPAELGYKTNFDNDAYPRAINFGGWWDTAQFTYPLPSPTGSTHKDRTALYFNLQQMLYRVDNTTQRGLTAFAFGGFDTSNEGPISKEVGGGLWDKGPLPFRPADSLGISFLWFNWNNAYATAFQDANGVPLRKNEYQLEVNYGFELAPGVELKPVLAYFINPDMEFGLVLPYNKRPSNAWLFGAQVSLSPNGAFGLPAFVRTN